MAKITKRDISPTRPRAKGNNTKGTKPNRVLVAYFSHSGNTRTIARQIHENVGGDIFEIVTVNPYPSDYSMVVDQAQKEIRAAYKPALTSKIDSIDTYDTIFVGSPNWCSTTAPPVASFLSEYNLAGKTVIPFCTHGGGGQAQVLKDMAGLCPNSIVLAGFDTYGNGGSSAKADISAWLSRIETLR